jgi:hypothetical protein
MPTKKVAHREKKSEKENNTMATKWVPYEFKESDLDKANKEGLLADDVSIVFPGTECIPKPPSGHRVMFLAFLLRGISLPAHKFLRGLLFCLWRAAPPAHA